MFELIYGKVIDKNPGYIVIDIGGIGFRVNVSLFTSTSAEVDENIRLFTYFVVKEKSIELYGFKNKKEREIFEKLISIPGIGPRIALAILSKGNPDDIYVALTDDDVRFFSSVPGIGAKKANRIVYELKGFVETKKDTSIYNEAIATLIALGLSRKEAETKLFKVKDLNSKKIEEIIKEALG